MTPPILKILYEFWIIDSYEPSKVNRSKLFKDNRTLVNYKSDIEKEQESVKPNEVEILIPDLNLPGINEDTFIDINGRNYIK